MTGNTRNEATRWHIEVPGARWFKADLHVHTLDDYPGARVSWSGNTREPFDDAILAAYAKAVLTTAVARGVEVLGLTPHAVYCQGRETLSAVWKVVETWKDGIDDDGIPFRDKVYAIFPGFEPSLADGARGVHLLFLFDPEIGREAFVRVFHAVMAGVDPWSGGRLNTAGGDAKEAFEAVEGLCERDGGRWNWLSLAPHALSSDRGLFGQLKSQILQYFPHEAVAGLELGDDRLPADHLASHEYLEAGMAKYGHCFFHASDAYTLNPDPTSTNLEELGSRVTVLKMAEPRIEALRQAFLAHDSRLRLAYDRGAPNERLMPVEVPDPLALSRPWLRSVRVDGGTSFFGGRDGTTTHSTTIQLNPDLTCIIGGRMAGKSTLLDGLRVMFGYPLPNDLQVQGDVVDRAGQRFSSGSPTVELDICGPVDPTSPVIERWPAVFFTQRELQQAVSDQSALRQLLFQLLPGRGPELRRQFDEIARLSRELQALVPRLMTATESLGEAEQALAASSASKEALERYESVGAGRLSVAQADLGRIRTAKTAATTAANALTSPIVTVESIALAPPMSDAMRAVFDDDAVQAVADLVAVARSGLVSAKAALESARDHLGTGETTVTIEITGLRRELEVALAAAGGSAEELNQFTALSTSAQLYEERRSAAEAARLGLDGLRTQFDASFASRALIREDHRTSMLGVTEAIKERFTEVIRVEVEPDGVDDELTEWVISLRERGITRWWNDVPRPIAPERILELLRSERLSELGMSDQVGRTFAEAMSESRKWELQALNCPDRYGLQLQVVAPNDYRALARLSGGQQVSLLLSLLLESDDTRPLVIDQPEDELDKSYLFETVLPALHRLKGHRQVIFATHDANIVVNGDADQVVYLEADADRGWVSAQGAIEQPAVKVALLTVLDGGPEAFELRSRKYGF
jgi:hypothetical protein